VNDSKVTAGAPGVRFEWGKVTSAERRTLIAASLGWMLDAFDVMIYSLVLTTLIRAFGMTKTTAGLLNTLTLGASAIGSVIFGLLADRFGRSRMLSLSILTYSISTFCCGLCRSIPTLAVCRFVLGLGMGGEWNTGAALVGETWPAHLRGRALGIVQSSWAVGYALAAFAAAILLTGGNWRLLFFVGVLPALLTFWIRRGVPEPAIWALRTKADRLSRNAAWRRVWPRAAALFTVNAFGMFAWWGLFTWLPAYLSLPGSQGGRGLELLSSYSLLTVLTLVGMFPGYLLFGVLADRYGRRTTMVSYLAAAAGMTLLFASARSPLGVFVSACLTAFFGTGFFTGSGIFGNELFPTVIRATALGVSYNAARGLSALAPLVIGRLSETRGLSAAFYICAAAFGAAAVCAVALPETRGTELA
jgi:MFS family permease